MTEAAKPSPTQRDLGQFVRSQLRNIAPLITLIALVLFFSIASPSFVTLDNAANIMAQVSLTAIIAVGLTFVILTGEIDLSVAAIANAIGIVAAFFTLQPDYANIQNVPMPGLIAVIFALAACLALGLITAFGVTRIGIPSFIMTLAMMQIAAGISAMLVRGQIAYNFPAVVQVLGSGKFMGLRWLTVVALVILLVAHLVLTYTRFGRYVYMTGGNRDAAEYSGVNVKFIISSVMVISAMLSGMAGMLGVAYFGSAQQNQFDTFLLDAIAAVVVGGTSLFGGRGGIGNTIVGLLVLGVLNNGLDHVNIDSFLKILIRGLILLIALIINVYAQKMRDFERGDRMTANRRRYKIAAIPGDGVGAEVVPAAIEVLRVLAEADGSFELAFDAFDWASERYWRTGAMMPADGLEQIRNHDAILFGAVGAPDVPDHVSLWGLRLAICQPFDQYANVRPIRLLPGITGPLRDVAPADLDWVIVRENSEGEYAGVGGRAHRGQPQEVATEVAVFTRVGVARIMRFAFALARSRPRKRLTVVTKSNAQRFGMVLWDDIAAEVAADFPDVMWDKMLVDAMTMRMVLRPASLDTIVATNLHADILSDLAAALAGSLGVAPTANLNPERRYPSMFEPIHGSAFDIAGRGIANPIGTFWSASLMLDHLGEPAAAARLLRAIEAATSDQSLHTPDIGGTARTAQVTEAVAAALRLPAAR